MSREPLPPPANKTAERLAVIVDAAERAALSVIDDAEKEAKRYLEEAQARADHIVAERLREAADQLEKYGPGPEQPPPPRPIEPEPRAEQKPPTPEEAAVVADPPPVTSPPTAERVRPAAEEPPAPEPVVRKPVVREPVFREPAPAARPAAPKNSGSAAARLLATQMAVSGSSRAEIETRLRSGFEIEDTREILDAILGPEG